MADVSIERALGAGFRLIRREPKAIALWGLAYAVFTIVVQLLAVGPAIGPILAAAQQDPDASAKAAEAALANQSLALMPLIWLLSIAGTIIFYCAVFRAELRPDDRKFAYFRFSEQELWTGLSYVVWLVLFSLGLGLAVLVAAIVLGLVTGGFERSAWPAAIVLAAPVLVGALYVGARLSMTGLLAFDRSRFIFLESWTFTRGHGWRLVLFTLALLFLMLIVVIGVVLAIALIGGALFLLAKAAGIFGVIVAVLVGLCLLVAYVLSAGALYALMIAPYADIFRQLRDSGADG